MRSTTDKLLIATGALLTAALAFAASAITGAPLIQRLEAQTGQAIAAAGGAPVVASFTDPFGQPSRHAVLSGGESLPEQKRARIAQAVGQVPGIGGIRWADGTAKAESGAMVLEPDHCQDDVVALLRTRTIRFEEGSAAIAPGNNMLLDEVADALRPCLGSVIAITGHTDRSGEEAVNLALSQQRALAVRDALVARGIRADGMQARGLGSAEPVADLAPGDPANRRIEFSVLLKPRLVPTPVDTPGPR